MRGRERRRFKLGYRRRKQAGYNRLREGSKCGYSPVDTASWVPEICFIALIVASIGVIFLIIAARLVLRSDISTGKVIGGLVAVTAVTITSEILGFAEQVFIPPNSLNRGIALFVALAGILLGVAGAVLTSKIRPLRILILIMAAGILFGDLTGWLRRSAGVSKYDSPAGRLGSAFVGPV